MRTALLSFIQPKNLDSSTWSEGADPFHARLLHERLKQTRRLVTVSLTLLLTLFVWAALFKVPHSAAGQAKVIPSKRIQIIQSVDGGIISDITVNEGDRVATGDTLVLIDTTRSASNLRENELQAAMLLFREARLKAQLAESKSFSVKPELKIQHPTLYQQEQQHLISTLDEHRAKIAGFEQQLQQRKNELQEASSLATAAYSSESLLKQELEQIRPLEASGAVSPIEILRLEKKLAQAKGEYLAAKAQAQRKKAAIEEAQTKIKEAQLKFETDTRAELAEVKSKMASNGQNQIELSDRVQKATIKSPIDGLVKRVFYSTRGAVLPPGQAILEIVPDDEVLVFETKVSPKDIGFIRPDQEATIRLSAYEFTSYGSLTGHVVDISPDSIIDEQNETYYLIKIVANANTLHQNLKLIPGMQADIRIRIDDRSVLSYLLKPLSRGLQNTFIER